MADLTATADIRSALGVSAKELPDTVLQNPIYMTMLLEGLADIHMSLYADFVIAAAAANPTDLQERFVSLTQAFSAYHIAMQCLPAIDMIAPQTIKDARSELTRQDNASAQLKKDLAASLAFFRARLRTVYAAINPEATVPLATERIYALAAGLGTDPVTG